MVVLPAAMSGRGARGLAGLVQAVLCVFPGCVLFEKTTTSTTISADGSVKDRVLIPKPAAGTTRPTRIGTFWQPNVVFAADPTRNGAPNAGMACRMWLFDENVGHPLLFEGKLCVDLYDVSPGPTGETLVRQLEQWQLPADVLRKLAKPDILGDGYTLFFPWATYRPDITRVQMKLRFDPTDGSAPIYSEPSMVTLGSSVGAVRSNPGVVGMPR